MSNKYKTGSEVPISVLCDRLDKLAEVVSNSPEAVRREFYMSIPVQLDHDADVVLSEAAIRLRKYKELSEDFHGCVDVQLDKFRKQAVADCKANIPIDAIKAAREALREKIDLHFSRSERDAKMSAIIRITELDKWLEEVK